MTLIMFFEFIIGLSDIYIAGKFGKEMQAAYGLSFELYFIFLIVAIALSVGSVSIASRLFTSLKKDELSTAISTSFITTLFFGLLSSAVGILCAPYVIQSLSVPEIVKSLAMPFLTIYASGFFFEYILINTNGILRACKSIQNSLITMTVVCLLNIALNFILAFRTPLKFNGIAVATVISLFFGCMLNIFYLKRLLPNRLSYSISLVKKIITISWPSGLLQILWQLNTMVLFIILGNLPKNSIEILAAFTSGLKIESAIFLPAFAFNMANAVVVGNSLGKHDYKKAVRGGMVTAAIGVGIVSALTIMVILYARTIVSFLSRNAIVTEECVRYIYISLLFEPVMAWGVIIGGGLNGAGDTKSVMKIVAFCVWLVRIPLSYIMGIYFGFGAIAIWWSMNVSIFIQATLITKRYLSKKWITKEVTVG